MRRVMRLRARSATPSSLMACFTVVLVFSLSLEKVAAVFANTLAKQGADWKQYPHLPVYARSLVGKTCLPSHVGAELMYDAVCFVVKDSWHLVVGIWYLLCRSVLSEGSEHRQECR